MRDYNQRIGTLLTELESLAEGHIRWFTHKNPYGCWICDLIQVFREYLTESIQADIQLRCEYSEQETMGAEERTNIDQVE